MNSKPPAPARAVLVGCGGISKAWFDALTQWDDVAVVGLVDLDVDAAAARRAGYPALADAACGDNLAAMIAALAPDVVFDCTVPAAHDGVAQTALEAGCDLLAEKPMASSVAAAKRLRDLANARGLNYAVVQNRRYVAGLRHLAGLTGHPDLGPLTTLDAEFAIGAHFGGFRDAMDHVLLIDMAIHTFDAARCISGCDPVAVYCHGFNPKGSWYAGHPAAVCIFEMTEGVVFTYRGSWCAEGVNTSWESRWRATGTRGSVTWDGHDRFAGQTLEDQARDESFMRPLCDFEVGVVPALDHEGHAGVIRAFLDARQNGTTPETAAADNVKSLAMVYAAVESSETKRRVEITV